MNMKIKKIILNLLILASYLFLIVLAAMGDAKINENKIITVFSLSAALIIYEYNHWNWLFVVWHKICAEIFGDTVSWKGSHEFFLKDNSDFKKIALDFKMKLIENEGFSFDVSRIQENSADFEVNIKGLYSKIRLQMEPANGYDTFHLSFSSNTSYRDSKNQINLFDGILSYLQKVVTNQIIPASENDMASGLKEALKVKIIMAKYNPFYKICLHHFDKDNELNWYLTIKEEKNLKVEITKHQLIVTSDNQSKIIKVLKNYVAISTVG
ncbi:hypothetical protein [Lentilactobacillus sunkii]|uniref:Uncharacterized protein n=1 Tax=Lentilactobacillus sunkii DSM 19904 TaxID=1423808 RepID=A0A0R1KW24_9LACO|nr:hypothetical protein [Lentilactobacillus sunkii]KRK87488.1 hypothetical protein FD17_GL001241 [Lentilactobacillus sunkii DSM 19904]